MKKMLCLLVCVAIFMLLLPTAAFAQPGKKASRVWIFGQLLASGGAATYYHNGSEDGAIGYTNNDKTGFNAYFNDYSATLTLNNLRVKDSDATTEDGINYAVYANGDLTIILCDESVISTENNGNQMTAALYVDGNLTLKNDPIDEYRTFTAMAQEGSGSRVDTIEQYGIYVTGKLKIEGKANLCGKVTGNVIAENALYVGVRANTIEIAGEQRAFLEGNTEESHVDASNEGRSYGIQAGSGGLMVSSGRVLGASGHASGATKKESYGIHAAAIRVENHGALMATRPETEASNSSAALSSPLDPGAGIRAKGLAVDTTEFVRYEASDNPDYMQVKTSYVMVSPESCDMRKGETIQFTAKEWEGTNLDDPVQTDNWHWTVEGGASGTGFRPNSSLLLVARNETAETITVKATSNTDSTFFGTAIVTSQPITVYNDSKNADATLWLTGAGLDSGDLLYTQRDPQGSAYEALTRLANSKDVMEVYDISLRSKIKSTGHPMNLTYDLNKEFPGQAFTAGESFTLVHQLANGKYEYFYDAAELNANNHAELAFGPLYELSPFMLVKGRLDPPTPPTPPTPTTPPTPPDLPQTGDNTPLTLLLGSMLMAAAALAGLVFYRRRVNQR